MRPSGLSVQLTYNDVGRPRIAMCVERKCTLRGILSSCPAQTSLHLHDWLPGGAPFQWLAYAEHGNEAGCCALTQVLVSRVQGLEAECDELRDQVVSANAERASLRQSLAVAEAAAEELRQSMAETSITAAQLQASLASERAMRQAFEHRLRELDGAAVMFGAQLAKVQVSSWVWAGAMTCCMPACMHSAVPLSLSDKVRLLSSSDISPRNYEGCLHMCMKELLLLTSLVSLKRCWTACKLHARALSMPMHLRRTSFAACSQSVTPRA